MIYETWVLVAATADRVWDCLVDVESLPRWTTSMTSVSLSGPFAVGASARVEQPRLPLATWVVSELTPGVSFTWETTALGVRTRAAHGLEDLGDQVRVTYRVEQSGLLAPLVGLATSRLTRRYVDAELAGLKRHAESR